jgi:hypothetical protein
MVYHCLNCGADLPSGDRMHICPACRQIAAINKASDTASSSRGGGGYSSSGSSSRSYSSSGDFSDMSAWFILSAFLIFDAYHHFAILKFVWFMAKVSVYLFCLGFFWASPASFGIGS